jgi:tyrosine-specific transport protein
MKANTSNKSELVSAIFLVAGTCIGAGMLALPLATGMSGLLPSLFMLVVTWALMTATALLFLEVGLWLPKGAHIISMSEKILGRPGKIFSWILYLFISYSSIIAYTAGVGLQVQTFMQPYFPFEITREIASFTFVTLFTGIVYVGSHFLGRINSLLFFGLMATFIILVGFGVDEVSPSRFLYQNWKFSCIGIPYLLTTFSFHAMVPSLIPFLERNVSALRRAVIGGTVLALVIFVIWECLILGAVPVEGDNGLIQGFIHGEKPVTQFLAEHVKGSFVAQIAEFFAFFAMTTSFLGFAMGLMDFLSDGTGIEKKGKGRILISLLIALPTALIATRFERMFLLAINASGAFGDTLLNGMLPVVLVWIGRYRLNMQGERMLCGGKRLLFFIFLLFLAAFLGELFRHLGFFTVCLV